MTVDTQTSFLIAAMAANGMMAGASLDQSIKQLPARRRMGVVAYAEYGMAADLANGVVWYSVLAGLALLTSVGAAVAGLINDPSGPMTAALVALLAVNAAWVAITTQAAPTYHSVRRAAGDESQLERIFSRFVRIQTARATVQATTLLVTAWALVATLADK
jgi:hypothetical protein